MQSASNYEIKKNCKKFTQNNVPWFDKDYQIIKKDLKILANKLKNTPNRVNIREKLFFTIRKLHSAPDKINDLTKYPEMGKQKTPNPIISGHLIG